MSQPSYDVIVIGEGLSGLTAAGELARAGLKVATIEGTLFGGLVVNINELHPAPDNRQVSGAELAAEMMQTNAEANVASLQEPVTALRLAGELVEVVTDSGTHTARHVVIASGARLRKLGVPGESEFEGRGVSQCADCDGPMYQNEEVVVVGGGDSALQEALVLAQFCETVHLIHRSETFRAASHWTEQVMANDKIEIIRNATVEEIIGSTMVEKARVRHRDGRSEELPCAGVFAYIGLEPNVEFIPNEVARDASGCLKVDENMQTSVAGVSAIGAVRSGYAGTLIDAVADARRAATAIKARLRPV